MEVDSELDDYEELLFLYLLCDRKKKKKKARKKRRFRVSANGSTFATSFHALATVTSSLYPVSDLSYKTGYFHTCSLKSSFALKFKNTLEASFR